MRNDLVELVFVIDASGSMNKLVQDTIGGFNSLIEKQKADEGETRVTAFTFNHSVKKIYDNTEVNSISPLSGYNYIPAGSTALYDGIGTAIDFVGERLAATPEDERPAKIIVVVITDGYENASKEYTLKDVKDRIEHQQTKYSWEFMYLGADINSMKEAKSLGFNPSFSKQYTASSEGTQTVYSAVNTVASSSKLQSRGVISDEDYYRSVTVALDGVK